MFTKIFDRLLIALLASLLLAPAAGALTRGEIEEIGRLPLEGPPNTASLDNILDLAAEPGTSEDWLEHFRDARVQGNGLDGFEREVGERRVRELAARAVHYALARQLYCLSTVDPAARTTPQEERRRRVVSALREGQLRLAIDFTRAERESVVRDRDGKIVERAVSQPGDRGFVTLSNRSFRQASPDHGGGAAGWSALERNLIHELAHSPHMDPREPPLLRDRFRFHPDAYGAHSAEWREFESYLWGLWQRCRRDRLADFGDAPEDDYPSRLFRRAAAQAVMDSDTGLRIDISLARWDELAQLGAHHLHTDAAWLGPQPVRPGGGCAAAGPGADGVSREEDSCQPRDAADDGVSGNVLTRNGAGEAEIEVEVSIGRPFAPGEILVLDAWVDWFDKGEAGWKAHPVEWTAVSIPGGVAPAWARIVRDRNRDGDPGERDPGRPHHVLIEPERWAAGVDTETLVLRFDAPRSSRSGGWARFRLFHFSSLAEFVDWPFSPDTDCGFSKLRHCAHRGQATSGEVEDYRLDNGNVPGARAGDLVRLFDDALDASLHSSGLAATVPGYSDLRNATVTLVEPAGCETLWSDCNVPTWEEEPDLVTDGRLLEMELELYEPVPEAPEAEFASWHFVVDLDGRRSTGHPGDRDPVGVFPDLGVDLWADVLWFDGAFHPFLFLGAGGVAELLPTPDLLTVRPAADGRSVAFELPLGVLEAILSDLAGEPVHADPERWRWVAVTNHAASPAELEDPPSDFFPERFYRPWRCRETLAGSPGLCLGDGRFLVSARWRTGQGTSGSGEPVELTSDTGAFWFFDAGNVELLVKVLDACSFDDRFWIFAAGLTDVEVELVVIDLATGAQRGYTNALGAPFRPILDTDAFGGSGAGLDACGDRATVPDGSAAALGTAAGAPSLPLSGALPGALPGAATVPLTLAADRFRVEVAWDTVHGTSGAGRPLGLTPDTGAFWFFEPDNLELVVKVLDACSFSGHFWVFAGGLTDVATEIVVTDTATGAVRRYGKAQSTPFEPLQDTFAFPCGGS